MNKPHLVVVCGVLYPNPSPTGLCAYRYASLLKELYDIEFIALTANGKEEDDVYGVFPVYTLSCIRLRLEHKTKGFVSKILHLIGSSQLKTRLHGNLGWYAKAAYKKLEELNQKRSIDAVFTVCSPLQAHIAGAKFKERHQQVRFCAYTVDPYATKARIVPLFRSYEDFVTLEKTISGKADCLLLSEEAMNTRQDLYGGLDNKMALPYLLPQTKQGEGGKYEAGKIHCVYAGSFYKDIRNPEYMLRVFSALKDNDVVLHLYSSGCDEIVRHYLDKSSCIESNGYVSQEELYGYYASCDFLVGVGNKMNDFLPSKTYEYLSLRRPIVFFNPVGYDNKVLERYPHSLQISDDMPIEVSSELFDNFVKREKGVAISEDELKRLYSENTGENIKRILLNGLNNN